jgi:hypothetical protein
VKISDEHKLNLKCVAAALVLFTIDVIDGGLENDNVINSLILWLAIGFCFGVILVNYRENKK